MEQKRTLWILLATGIFLLVVLGFAMLPFASSARTKSDARALRNDGIIWVAPSSSNSSSSNLPEISNQNNESQNEFSKDLNLTENENIADFSNSNVQENPLNSAISSQKEGTVEISENSKSPLPYATDNLTVISTGTTNFYDYSSKNSSASDEITTIDLNNLKTSEESVVKAQNQTAQKAIQETQNSKLQQEKLAENKNYQNQSDESVSKTSVKSASTQNTKNLSSTKSNSTATSSVSSAKTSSAKNTASNNSSVEKPTEKIPDRFWVQAASYTSKKNADEARAILDENKIQCEVFTYTDSKNNLYYRLRVGPYTTKTEAEYWKNRIDSIELFKNNNTYVTNSSAAKK